jgi:flagellin-like hook-associated protein FlgL
VKSVRGHLLEFQTNSPANNYAYLSSPSGTLNTLSTIRDSDYAAQVAEFTKSQLQPNAALFSTTNNIPSLVELLLKNEVLT